MPTCNRCGRVAASAEMRKSPKAGFFCKDKWDCEQRTEAGKGGRLSVREYPEVLKRLGDA